MIRPPTLGAPGLYRGRSEPIRRLAAVRLDACAFLGVAPRGPARLPAADPEWVERRWEGGTRAARTVAVPVESWEEYLRLYGGFEGPGLLPYSVASFFEQGGRRAYVARIVPDFGTAEDHEGVASGPIPDLMPAGPPATRFVARAEGTGGQGIRIALEWEEFALAAPAVGTDGRTVGVDAEPHLMPGATLRVVDAGGEVGFRLVSGVRPDSGGTGRTVAVLDGPPVGSAAALSVLEARLEVTAPGEPPEVHAGLGLSPAHPAWLAAVLEADSSWVRPDPRWSESPLVPTVADPVASPTAVVLAGGWGTRRALGALRGLVARRNGLWLQARSEGAWGNRLRVVFRLDSRILHPLALGAGEIVLDPGRSLPVGSLVRCSYAVGGVIRRVRDAGEVWDDTGRRVLRIELDGAVPPDPEAVELLEGRLSIRETGDDLATVDRSELHVGLGLEPGHPRWIGKVLALESELVRPDPEWLDDSVEPSAEALLDAVPTEGSFRGGTDRWPALTPEDFFDTGWTRGDEEAGEGVHCLAETSDLALLVAPDLYSPEPLAPLRPVADPGPTAGAEFAPCLPSSPPAVQARPAPALDGLRLVPTDAADLEAIVALQRRLVDFADGRGDLHALLSVPPGLTHAQVLAWRARIHSHQAAAYHPWIRVSEVSDGRDLLVRVPPAGAAAGIVARSEELHGVPHGPANVLVQGAVDVDQRVSDLQHDALHPAGINVLRRERDGIRLTGARTLAAGPRYRQLSVRRLVTLLVRTLEQQMQWTVFEPNGRRLRRDVRGLVAQLLSRLFRAGAFTGRSEEEAFFVRCDDELNPPRVVDAGRLVCQVGIAPSEPLEFIVLRLVRGGDGTLRREDGA